MGKTSSKQRLEQGRVCCRVRSLLFSERSLLMKIDSYYSEIGIGVKADGEEAKMWYLRAAGRSSVLQSGACADPSAWQLPGIAERCSD